MSALYRLICIVALRNEKGSYNSLLQLNTIKLIVALRNEKGSYNQKITFIFNDKIVALRNEKGSYNYMPPRRPAHDCSTAK